MGKSKTINPRLWGYQNPKEWAELKERYDVRGSQGGKPDNYGPGSDQRDREDVYNDIMKASRLDYDTRRSLEAAGLSGDKKAAKLSKGGFNSLNDVAKAQEVLGRLKKEHVGGGGMGGAKNIMGLTDALVNLDRDNLLEKIASSGPEPANIKKEPDPTSPSLGETEDGRSPYVTDAQKRNQEYSKDKVFAKKSSDKYNAMDVTETNKEYKQADAFNFLADYKLDLQSKYN